MVSDDAVEDGACLARNSKNILVSMPSNPVTINKTKKKAVTIPLSEAGSTLEVIERMRGATHGPRAAKVAPTYHSLSFCA